MLNGIQLSISFGNIFQELLRGFSQRIYNSNSSGGFVLEFLREFPPETGPGVFFFRNASRNSSEDLLQEFLRRFSPRILLGTSPKNFSGIFSRNFSGNSQQQFLREFCPEFSLEISSRNSLRNSFGDFSEISFKNSSEGFLEQLLRKFSPESNPVIFSINFCGAIPPGINSFVPGTYLGIFSRNYSRDFFHEPLLRFFTRISSWPSIFLKNFLQKFLKRLFPRMPP